VVDFKKVFQKEYTKLNPQQKTAVDAIAGPVMVIAGAGTGKTQTIALRVANILKKTDTPPSSILCLTFTDNASFNMRQRLLSLIGSTAYSVQIHTFHSFCNTVIQSNPDKFKQTDLTSIEEIDKIAIITKIIDKLALNSPLKPRGAPYFYLSSIISSIQTLKREAFSPKSFFKLNLSHQRFIQANQANFQHLKSLRSSKSLETDLLQILKNILENKHTGSVFKALFSSKYKLYQDGYYVSGKAKNPTINFKNDLLLTFDKVTKNLDKHLQLQLIYGQYQKQLKKLAYYDFDDMINFVTSCFKKDPDFLRTFQEQIHYILVDEFQDSNNSQIKLLHLLSSYFSHPNLFVVGDDDQSIFRFQGASVENILTFYQKYQPQTFVLVNNYRSHQLILDSAHSLISKNQTQLTNLIKNIDKNLISQVDYDPDPINLFELTSPLEEANLVATKIENLLKSGVNPSDIAVLYRQHTDADLLAGLLLQKNIKFGRSKHNCLKSDHLSFFIRILSAIADTSSNVNLYSLLCLPFLKISPLTLTKILHSLRSKHVDLVDYVYSSDLKSKKIKKIIKKIANCQVQSQNLPLNRLFIYILDQFSYLKYLSARSDSFTATSDLYSLFSYIKSFEQSHPKASLKDFVNRLNLLTQNNLSIPQANQTTQADQINLLTVHGAKGLEFDHVFIINCINGRWGNGRRMDKLPLPFGIVKSKPIDDANQEERRLCYVALTRAKKQIYLSFSNANLIGRPQAPSQFIFEIDPKLIEAKPVDSHLDQNLFNSVLSIDKTDKFITTQNRDYLLSYLKNSYKFNITHLNSYLNCPHCFYYKTILKIPLAKTASLSFGTAIHASLAYLYLHPKSDLSVLYKVFQNILANEFLTQSDYQSLLPQGQTVLKNYLKNHPKLIGDYKVEENFSGHNIHLGDIPLTGKIDKIEILPTKTGTKSDIIITDFKTGKPDYATSKIAPRFDSKAGSYFRQILFYKLLLDLSSRFNYHLKSAMVEYVEPDKNGQFIEKVIDIKDEDIATLKALIKDTYNSILDLKFPINPNCRDPDGLHNLI